MGDASKDEFTQSRMAIAAHYHEVRVAVGAMRQQSVGCVNITAGKPLDLHFKPMAGEMLTDINGLDVVLLAAFVGDDNDFDATAFK
jgi:hypothetical protein